MIERIVSHRLADIVEAIERLHKVLDGVNLELFEHDWEKRWLVERGIEVISEASRHLTEDIKTRQAIFHGEKSQVLVTFFATLTITLRRMCFGNSRKTICRS